MAFVLIDADGAETSWPSAHTAGIVRATAAALAKACAPGDAIGLLFPSGASLITTWFACLAAGLRPLIVQYPTRKQSRAYWFDSVTDTVRRADLAAIIADDHCTVIGLPEGVRVIPAATLPTTGTTAPPDTPLLPEDFTILQLSSGTTGHRKAMAFTAAALRRHAADFNQVLRLDPARDRIVSWLPLYHDMGYVACFVMPILLGIEVVMMDPVTWVQTPALLFDAIARHRGTLCYMPNFGFEVMTRSPAPPMPSMRHWVSCSEPVSPATAQKFCAHINADPSTFAPCYAMAENLFAVTFATGIETRTIEGAEIVSCGPPIPGVQLKIIAGEIWARSPTSLQNYLGGEDIRDADGYYPTGDLGALLDGALYVAGRKADVLIQAGRKFMLSDVDLTLNAAYPDIRGRAATLAVHDARLGTETPLVLIEALDFFDRTDMAAIAAHMIDLTGMDQLELAYVPPRFITKTSSGKINRRKTRDDWLAVQTARHRTAGPRDAVAELRASFARLDWSRPMREVLDSLSATLVRITLDATTVPFDPAQSLDALAGALAAAAPPRQALPPAPGTTTDSLRLVSISDSKALSTITEADLEHLGAMLGCPVTLEHVCLPPAAIVLSDLIFHDWFQPRLDQTPFADIDHALQRVKQASVILVDNIGEMKFALSSTYPALSHALNRDPAADLICVRWPGYTRQHHRLPLTCVSGAELPLDQVDSVLDQLARYVGVPVFRIASMPGFETYCAAWDYHPKGGPQRPGAARRFSQALAAWIAARPVRRRPRRPGPALLMSDSQHFCAIAASRAAVDAVVARFDRFCVVGSPASLPYLRAELERHGKPYVLVPSYAPTMLDGVTEPYDCIVCCGAMGTLQTALPVISFQHIGQQDRTRNLGAFEPTLLRAGPLNASPASGQDWFHSFPLERSTAIRQVWRDARKTLTEARKARRTARMGSPTIPDQR